MDKRKPRLYFTLVELSTHEKAALLIMRFADSFGAQLTGHNGFLRQVSAKVTSPEFATCELAELLMYVGKGFEKVHGIKFDLMIPEAMSVDEWAENMEKRADDPRYIVFERPGEKGWFYGVDADDLPAMRREIREDVLGPEGMKILRARVRLQSERRGRALH
ncbi:hypothetical protein [Rhizobium fabae]|uniref:Uncharacterized protein n=1 Tax=Rhizobium fabae TaxID=573179 RepID=A0A7W6B5X7_9HYPH|nr:hypothetical protein [Rhizobium fabae]MBB3915566.1 hypothetical protein [Rhizobium fabae]RUM11852.1 hypothetical protein EFB14_15805 [Rhizobium fabae]